MSYAPTFRDVTTRAGLSIQVPGWKIHTGQHYIASDIQSVSTTTYKWGLTTPAGSTKSYLIWGLHCTGEVKFEFIENPTTYSGGSAWGSYNHDRSSVNTAGITLLKGITYTGGNVIDCFRNGSTAGGIAAQDALSQREELEYILLPSEQYVFAVETFAAVYVTLRLNWYEHLPLT
jgi:hypothetical protein